MANSFIILQFVHIVSKYIREDNLECKFVGKRNSVVDQIYDFVSFMLCNHIDETEPIQTVWHRVVISDWGISSIKYICHVEGVYD